MVISSLLLQSMRSNERKINACVSLLATQFLCCCLKKGIRCIVMFGRRQSEYDEEITPGWNLWPPCRILEDGVKTDRKYKSRSPLTLSRPYKLASSHHRHVASLLLTNPSTSVSQSRCRDILLLKII